MRAKPNPQGCATIAATAVFYRIKTQYSTSTKHTHRYFSSKCVSNCTLLHTKTYRAYTAVTTKHDMVEGFFVLHNTIARTGTSERKQH